MPIALLKFPTDLLGEVFKECNPFELYNVSLCSQRIRSVLKSRMPRCWKISSDFIAIGVMCRKDDAYKFEVARSPEDCYKVNVRRTMQIKFRNGKVMDSLDYMLDIFGCSTMKCMAFLVYNDLLKFSKIAIDKKLEIEECHIDEMNNDQEFSDSLALINQLNITKLIELNHRVSSRIVPHRITRFPDELRINNSSWFSIEQLMICTSARIYLKHSSLNNEDMDRFLQKWKRGELPNLRVMKGSSSKLDSESPILEMYPPIRGQTKTSIKRISVDDPYTIYGVKVHNDQGLEGLLEINLVPRYSRFSFIVIDPTDTVTEEIDENFVEAEED